MDRSEICNLQLITFLCEFTPLLLGYSEWNVQYTLRHIQSNPICHCDKNFEKHILCVTIKIKRPQNIFYQTQFLRIFTTRGLSVLSYMSIFTRSKSALFDKVLLQFAISLFQKGLRICQDYNCLWFCSNWCAAAAFFLLQCNCQVIARKNMIQSKTITFFMLVFS